MTAAGLSDQTLAKDRGRPRLTYISWAESCSRSDHTARELGGRSYMVYAPQYGSRAATILFKYAAQWRQTAKILDREQPDVVAVMTPPLVASLAVLVYLRRHGGQLVLDAHSAAFLHPRWRTLQWLQRWLCRQATATLVHNDHIGGLVRGAGGQAILVPDIPVTFSEVEHLARSAAFTVVVVCSFNYDEPIKAIMAAARLTPEVQYLITGNASRLKAHDVPTIPDNVSLTGFVSIPAYGGLLTGADAVMTLTTRDHTMLRGAYEAIYQGTPVIVSDWPLLREEFPLGAEHVDNSAEGIARGVRRLQADWQSYREGAARLRERKLARWEATRRVLEAELMSAAEPAP